jgi:hypothetical protein
MNVLIQLKRKHFKGFPSVINQKCNKAQKLQFIGKRALFV